MGSLNRFNFLLVVILLTCQNANSEMNETETDQISAAETVGQGVANAIDFSTKHVVIFQILKVFQKCKIFQLVFYRRRK